MTKPTILTGLRANNDLTIGNYFGGMLPIINMAKQRAGEFQINMFIPDLHSFTTPIDHCQLYQNILANARLFAAAGLPLDNDDIHLYRQSYIPAHSELTWILDCFTGYGQMARMTQFKEKTTTVEKISNLTTDDSSDLETQSGDKIEAVQSEASVGLFNYPVLMAADILLYGAKYVPVGDDQTQHLEFTRDIAERMNRQFNNLFTVPEAVKDQQSFFGQSEGLRIKDLVNPAKKMSKSDDSGRGVIFLSDSPEEASKKVMGATTDDLALIAHNPVTQPGISNLIDILALLRGQPVARVADEFAGRQRYGDFKQVVAAEVAQFLTDFQARLAQVDGSLVISKLEQSEAAMARQANQTLLRVQQAVGLRPRT